MNHTLTWQLREITSNPAPHSRLACESSLWIAAATLSHAAPNEITSTTVVGVLGRDDPAAFQQLVADVAEGHALVARTTLNVGSFSVRFSRRAASSDANSR